MSDNATTPAHSHGPEVTKSLGRIGRDLRTLIPQVYDGYKQLHDAALADGALDVKTKELIALGIAVSKQCDGCIAAHTRTLASVGATDVEVAEAIGVAIMMNGGPGTVYGPRALAAFKEWRAAEK